MPPPPAGGPPTGVVGLEVGQSTLKTLNLPAPWAWSVSHVSLYCPLGRSTASVRPLPVRSAVNVPVRVAPPGTSGWVWMVQLTFSPGSKLNAAR